ncbi:pre-16S rRNA-processing nuclease YqgF [Candidatus Collierbacteria bacterium]|nr:pre-16S rRNA-processing nuclease YqgF [Candidatus Collierbacteria bacterium]
MNHKSKIYLAIDPGLSQIGIAISHEGKLAEPLTTFESHDLINQIRILIEKHHPGVIVIGEPNTGPIKDLALVLHDEIKAIFSGEVILHPEDLSSQEANQKMVEGGMAKQRRQEGNHAAAAALILQDFLDLKL